MTTPTERELIAKLTAELAKEEARVLRLSLELEQAQETAALLLHELRRQLAKEAK